LVAVSLQTEGALKKSRVWLPSLVAAIAIIFTLLYYIFIIRRFKRLFRQYPTFHDNPHTEVNEAQPAPDKILAAGHDILRPLEGLLGKLDGGVAGKDGSDNHANKIDNLEERLLASCAGREAVLCNGVCPP
jgi:hypothetical protein